MVVGRYHAKWFVSKHRRDAAKYGRGIVRSCMDWSGDTKWMCLIQRVCSVEQGLCELIRGHVERVTGCEQSASAYGTPAAAYASWLDVTASYFGIPAGAKDVEPLVILYNAGGYALCEH